MPKKHLDYAGPLMKLFGLKRRRGRPHEVLLDPVALLRDIAKVLAKFPKTASERAIAQRLQGDWAARTLEQPYKDISYRTLRRNIADVMKIVRALARAGKITRGNCIAMTAYYLGHKSIYAD
jgi:hypothetical protein